MRPHRKQHTVVRLLPWIRGTFIVSLGLMCLCFSLLGSTAINVLAITVMIIAAASFIAATWITYIPLGSSFQQTWVTLTTPERVAGCIAAVLVLFAFLLQPKSWYIFVAVLMVYGWTLGSSWRTHRRHMRQL